MRKFLSSAMSSLMAGAMFTVAFMDPVPRVDAYGNGPKRRKTGETYPHSSARQRARYARQIAAGQIRNTPPRQLAQAA